MYESPTHDPHPSRRVRRRQFMGNLGLGTIGLLASGQALASGYPANETIEAGFIGTGGRCFHALLPSLKKVQGTRVAAVCDVWDTNLARARKEAAPDALATKDYRKVLERKNIDVVVIGTPDHWHVPLTVAACKAGKDVYVEKPLTHDLSEGDVVIAAQNDNKRIVQVGMQQRSMPQFRKALEVARSGRLGKIIKVHMSWNRNSSFSKGGYGIDPKTVDWKMFVGPAPEQPYDEYRFRHWRWIWDFGGGILTDLMVHYIDIMNWYLEVDNPRTAWTMGDHFQARGYWETPDTIQTLLQYPEHELQAYFEGTFSNARNRAMIELMGTDATLYVDRGRYEVYPERGKGEYEKFGPGVSVRGADFDRAVDGGYLHMQNFIDCVRSRKKPYAPAEAGVSAVLGAHLGNRSYRTGRVAHWYT